MSDGSCVDRGVAVKPDILEQDGVTANLSECGAWVGPSGEADIVSTCRRFGGGPLGVLVAKVVGGVDAGACVGDGPRQEGFRGDPYANGGVAKVATEIVHADVTFAAASPVGACDGVAREAGIDLRKDRLAAVCAQRGDDLVGTRADVVDGGDVVVSDKGACARGWARTGACGASACGFERDDYVKACVGERSRIVGADVYTEVVARAKEAGGAKQRGVGADEDGAVVAAKARTVRCDVVNARTNAGDGGDAVLVADRDSRSGRVGGCEVMARATDLVDGSVAIVVDVVAACFGDRGACGDRTGGS